MSLLSVIVPCYNEEESIALFYEEFTKNDVFFREKNIEVELLFIDDGSRDGTVKEVFEDETVGNYVVVEHENGWKTTYSQLADIKVAAGDTVSKGEVLGSVAQPSIYSSAMGPHLEFTVMLDDMTVDDIEKALNIKIKITGESGEELIDTILE